MVAHTPKIDLSKLTTESRNPNTVDIDKVYGSGSTAASHIS